LILRLDPGLDLGGVVVFEPAVGVGDLRAVVIVDHVHLLRLRINDLFLFVPVARGQENGQDGNQQDGKQDFFHHKPPQ